MASYLDVFEWEFYSFERLAPFILAVQKFRPEIISALKDMQISLISAIENNEKELSSLHKIDKYELSLYCIDFMKDDNNDAFLRDSEENYVKFLNLEITDLTKSLQSPNITNKEKERITRLIEKIKKDQTEYLPKQKEKLEKLTRKIKEENRELLKFTAPHPFMLSDLIHEYDFVKIIAWYYFLNDKNQFAEKLQSSETSHQEKIEIVQKNHFFFTRILKNCDGKTIDIQEMIVPDDVFYHRRIKREKQVHSEVIGKLEKSKVGYTVAVNSTIKISDNLQINEQELISSIRDAIYISLCGNYERIGEENGFDAEKTFSDIDSIIQEQKKKLDKRLKGRIMDMINGLAISKINTGNISIASSIEKIKIELKDRFNQNQRLEHDKLESIYRKAAKEINKYQTFLK